MSQTFLLLGISILTAATAQFCFRKGVLVLGEINFSLAKFFSLTLQTFQNIWLLVGVILFLISFILWLFILSKMQLNMAYPISVGLQTTILSLIGLFFLHESLSPWQILGIAVIIIGIFLLLSKGAVL